ncbi:MAG: hypothetical protein ACOYJU_06400 [Anaerovoracaceae bacterium]|jgi:hypothetical protein
MKYITEDVLRDIYRREPFTSYELEEGARLTPGARQFLADRGINMFEDGSTMDMGNGTPITKQAAAKAKCKDRKEKFDLCVDLIISHFLITGQELCQCDILLAKDVLDMGECLRELKTAPTGSPLVEIQWQGCTGMTDEDKEKDLGDCFEITAFHVQMPKGREIVLLHRLRSQLRQCAVDLLELEEAASKSRTEGRINLLINKLSRMICSAVGGTECQRMM